MHPLPEYPRPSMRRDSYVNLNGLWDYAITQSSEFPAKWDGAILVPYSPEAKASGVGRTLQPGQWLHYHRTFTPPAGEGGRVLLHFGAVDYACAVEVNGRLAGGHRGGYWPFTLDITDYLRPDRNTLWVAVQDPTGTGTQARGKQTLRPGGMFYPAQSGIWQTVWLERVPDTMEELLKLPGVGRKTANLILGDVHRTPGVVVADTHCIRITGLLGLTDGTKDPGKVEKQLRACLPPEESNDFCHRLVLHGRAVCRARKPDCPNCTLRPWCDHFQNSKEG